MPEQTLELGVIGNGAYAALIDAQARVVWWCLPAFDGDPACCALLQPRAHDAGYIEVALEDLVESRQQYLGNSAVLVTTLRDRAGAEVEVLDFAPRYKQYGRVFHPVMLVRRIRPLAGALLLPYWAWVTFATALTWSTWQLNPQVLR